MNLLFRFFALMLKMKFKEPVSVLGPCRTEFRCWPSDLDLLRHMNNGKYFSLMDLARVDLMGRAGLWKKLNEAGFYPVVVAETMKFKKSIQPFQKFEIVTTVLGWDEKAFILEQKFMVKDIVMAEAVVRARFLKKTKTGGSVMPAEILKLADVDRDSPKLSAWIANWNSNQLG